MFVVCSIASNKTKKTCMEKYAGVTDTIVVMIILRRYAFIYYIFSLTPLENLEIFM